MAVRISDRIRAKLAAEHDVGVPEVEQCFANRTGHLLMDMPPIPRHGGS